MLDKRSESILSKILKSYPYISVEDLSKYFNVSRRTIYTDLDILDQWLNEHYSSEIKRLRGKGLYVTSTLKNKILNDKNVFSESYYEFSKKERIACIYIYLFYYSKRFILKDFQQILQVSRNTVINDIKVLKKE